MYTLLVYNLSMNDIYDVTLTVGALKDLKRVPLNIAIKLQAWIDIVAHRGLSEVRKISGYHDEPLKGKRKSERSIRLNRGYRAIYRIKENKMVHFVEIREVNKHEY